MHARRNLRDLLSPIVLHGQPGQFVQDFLSNWLPSTVRVCTIFLLLPSPLFRFSVGSSYKIRCLHPWAKAAFLLLRTFLNITTRAIMANMATYITKLWQPFITSNMILNCL
ncbi:hypothetical protein SESBI_12592 [Sesbania bispinosa]|nr:hypothetical protein SESBI_12592 [Sesbania bispinosa]